MKDKTVYKNPMIKKNCAFCNKEFESNIYNAKYCSNKCSILIARKNKKKYSAKPKEERLDPNRTDDTVFKKPLYENVPFSANEDKAIEVLRKNGFNKRIIAEVLGRKEGSIKARTVAVNFSFFKKNNTFSALDQNIEEKNKLYIDSVDKFKIIELFTNQLIYKKLILNKFQLFKVSTENNEIDLVLLKNHKFFKLQLKTASFKKETNNYEISCRTFFKFKEKKFTDFKYPNIDFFIFNLIGRDISYVIPSSEIFNNIKPTNSIRFTPDRLRSQQSLDYKVTSHNEEYREAFDLIK
jgi:hypothetical protein